MLASCKNMETLEIKKKLHRFRDQKKFHFIRPQNRVIRNVGTIFGRFESNVNITYCIKSFHFPLPCLLAYCSQETICQMYIEFTYATVSLLANHMQFKA